MASHFDRPQTVQCPHCGADIGTSDYEKMQHMNARHRDILRARHAKRYPGGEPRPRYR